MFDADEIGQYDFTESHVSQATTTQIIGRIRSSVASADLKAQALLKNYADPMANIMQACQDSYQTPAAINE